MANTKKFKRDAKRLAKKQVIKCKKRRREEDNSYVTVTKVRETLALGMILTAVLVAVGIVLGTPLSFGDLFRFDNFSVEKVKQEK